jgi:hypothetical protein
VFLGKFDGDGHIIRSLTISGGSYLGVFGELSEGSEVRNLGVVEANVTDAGEHVGGLVGINLGGRLRSCFSTGAVSGSGAVGGLVGLNYDFVTVQALALGVVDFEVSLPVITDCYSSARVNGLQQGPLLFAGVGGLVGINAGSLSRCYSTGSVSGNESVGGLVGIRLELEPPGWLGATRGCFWDTQTSGRTSSAVGAGKTTAEMQMARTFLDAGWDFISETANGTQDIWWINEGKDYPRLCWEMAGGK